MFPLGFVFGAVAGVATMLILGPEIAQRARPAAKAALKAALIAVREAQIQGMELVEAAEDLVAEAKAEARGAGAGEPAQPPSHSPARPQAGAGARRSGGKAARKRTPATRPKKTSTAHD